MHKYTTLIEDAVKKAESGISKINNSILSLEGMTGHCTRHFYNNICSVSNARYLEIGTWKGSSLCSAMYGNNMVCVCIDNWSYPGGSTKDAFYENFNRFKGENNATVIEDDCWNVDPDKLGSFNIYMYDGDHTEECHYRALDHFMNCLDNEFIYLVDDWNAEEVRSGTIKAVSDNNLEIISKKEIFTTHNPGIQTSGRLNDWHNGIGIFVLRKL